MEFTLDPTVTPMMDGDRSILSLGVDARMTYGKFFAIQQLVGDVEEFCAIPGEDWEECDLECQACSAGHTILLRLSLRRCFSRACSFLFQPAMCDGSVSWISGGIRAQMNEVRSIRLKDLPTCSSCSPCLDLFPLSGAGIYGRKYARALVAGLREVVCAHWHSFREHVE